MNPSTFDTLVNSIKGNDSSDHKMYLMKITIGGDGAISVPQVVRLLKYLPLDNDKLELAKMAYGHVNDSYSYDDIVGEAFSSSSTRASLYEYVHRRY